MKIGIVGYQGSGKSTLFHWLTGVAPDPAKSHETQSAMAPVPDERFGPLCTGYISFEPSHTLYVDEDAQVWLEASPGSVTPRRR